MIPPTVSVWLEVFGTNHDKSGYSLNANGLDLVMVETGVNLRQAVSPILAATAEVISRPSTGQITIKAGNNSSTKIVATRDKIGNRTTVVFDSARVINKLRRKWLGFSVRPADFQRVKFL